MVTPALGHRLPLRFKKELITVFKVSGSLRLDQLAPRP
jgi:hypothetical protein